MRALDSKAMTVQMSKERIKQIQDKVVRKLQLSADENAIFVEWNKKLQSGHQVEIQKQADQLQADMDTAAGLHDQVHTNKTRRTGVDTAIFFSLTSSLCSILDGRKFKEER